MIPNPGSPRAIHEGCTCPIMDNCGGKGLGDTGLFWVNNSCPLHGDKGWRREVLEKRGIK